MLHLYIIPVCVSISFFLLVFFICVNIREIKNFLARIDKKTWLILMIIFVVGLSLRLFLPSKQHIIFWDEPGHMAAAKTLLSSGQIDEANMKSAGWPFILAIGFGLFGIGSKTAIYTSLIFGALTVINIFCLGLIIFKNKLVSLAAAFFFALLPLHIRWSASAESNIVSLFFVTLALLFCLLYIESKKYLLLWLALAAIFFAAQFRPENYILPVLFLTALLIFDKTLLFKFFKEREKPLVSLAVTAFFALPNFFRVLNIQMSANWIESDSAGLMTGSNWSLANLINNSVNYGGNLFNGKYEPIIFVALFAIGFFYLLKNDFRKALFFLVWYFCFYFIYFSSWFQTLGARDRFYMSFYPITALLAALGLLAFGQIILRRFNLFHRRNFVYSFLVIVIIAFFIPSVRDSSSLHANLFENWQTKMPERAKREIPSDCLIVARFPITLKAVSDFKVVSIDEFLNQKPKIEKSQCVLFLRDIGCDWPRRSDESDWCSEIASVCRLEPLLVDILSDNGNSQEVKTFGFYQLFNK